MTEADILCLICMVLLMTRGLIAEGDVGLGMECTTDTDCRQFAYCVGRICACRETYLPNKDNTTCLAGLRQRCQYDDSCVPNAYCRRQERCECKDGYLPTTDLLHCNSAGSTLSLSPLLLISIRFLLLP